MFFSFQMLSHQVYLVEILCPYPKNRGASSLNTVSKELQCVTLTLYNISNPLHSLNVFKLSIYFTYWLGKVKVTHLFLLLNLYLRLILLIGSLLLFPTCLKAGIGILKTQNFVYKVHMWPMWMNLSCFFRAKKELCVTLNSLWWNLSALDASRRYFLHCNLWGIAWQSTSIEGHVLPAPPSFFFFFGPIPVPHKLIYC